MNKIKISILIPVYFNEPNMKYTIPRLQALQGLLPKYELEFVFVDDGSQDRSLLLLLEAKQCDPRIKIVKLSKNFGAMAAIQAGLRYVTGDCVGIINADLQDPPELFAEMVSKWAEGSKVVMAVRKDREESLTQKMFSHTYYLLMDKLALHGYPRGGFDFVLIDKQIVEELTQINEKNTNIMSLIFWLGHNQSFIPYVRRKREHGVSKWTLAKKVKLFVDSFVSFSYAPIRFMSCAGFVIALLSFFYGIFVVFNALTGTAVVQGWTSIVAIITFLLGLIMMMLGIIGEYLWRVLDEARNRPSYIIDEVYE